MHVDIETFSSVDLKKCGVARYAESPDFEVLLFGYAIGEQPWRVIDLAQGEKIPAEALDALFDYRVRKKAFNANFEMTCLSQHLQEPLPAEQWECTSVHALYVGLPNDLGGVCDVLRVPEQYRKQKAGYGLIRTFCVPCKPTKKNGGRTRTLPHHEPEKWELFKEYCGMDVESERYVAGKLAKYPVPKKERDLWILDQKMFRHGVGVDMDLVDAAIYCDSVVKETLTREACALTGLSNPNSVKQLIAWLNEEMDEDTDNLRKKTVPALLASASSDTVRRALELRQEMSKTSVKKYVAMARSVCEDHRLRGVTQFYGANRTGRWAGRIVQLQNLPQNHLKDLPLAREMVKARDIEGIEMLFGSVPDVLSQLIRTALVPSPGKKMIPCDFSAIEARVTAWLAWCQWRIDVFNGDGKIYEASAEQMFKLPKGSVTKKSPYRQKGKVGELACGFGSGVNGLINMGALDMGLAEEELQPIVDSWRAANPEIVKLWHTLETAAKEAIRGKKKVEFKVAGGRVKMAFTYEKGMLTWTLPSGRQLFYVRARVEPEDLWQDLANGGRMLVAREGSITYEGTDQKTKRWCRLSTWGGKLLENGCQAIARDCLGEAMLRLDAADFSLLFTVHDEVVPEEQTDRLEEIEQIMGRPIPWAPDLPLPAEGFITPYYQKETD
jgi:DNA polymerase bacteriophage-type